MTKNNIFGHIKSDFASGLVVFLVALPLCLGIAMASNAPLLSGIISGIIGGIVVGFLSTSHVSVSGPAAGLTAIVITSISDLGAFDVFLLAVVLSGLMQVVLGFIKAGTISNYFPTNVIEGMLAGIGIIIFLKQIPHAVGFDIVSEGDTSFWESDGNVLTTLLNALQHINFGAIIITFTSLFILIFWEKVRFTKKLKIIPPALLAVISGILINEFFIRIGSHLMITKEHLVPLPVPESFQDFKSMIIFPNFSEILNQKVWIVAITITIVASIETLLCIEASDRLDDQKRFTNTNNELKAQGIGNILSGLIGGLPMTSVVVRSSANINAGAKTKMSTMIHGFLLLFSLLFLANFLNKIPFATLAAVLLLIGFKLANPAVFLHFYSKGKYQFLPFIITVLAVVWLDLLMGVALGMLVSFLFVLKGNLKRAYYFRKEAYKDGDIIHIDLAQEVSFLNKAAIKCTLNTLPKKSTVVINASDTVYISHDVLDLIREFKEIKSKDLKIDVKLVGFKDAYDLGNISESSHQVSFEKNNH